MTPQPRWPSAAGRSRWSGVTARAAVTVRAGVGRLPRVPPAPSSPSTAPTSAMSSCQPSGRSAGMMKVACPVRTPSTMRARVQSSVCDSSRWSPSSSCTRRRSAAPSGAWTTTGLWIPPRTTTAGGRTRRQGASPASRRECSTSTGVEAATPRARRTATRVSREGEARLPWKSQYSVEMPWASASCLRRSPAGSDAERESVIAGTAL